LRQQSRKEEAVADIAKRCKAAADECKSLAQELDKLADKKKGELDAIIKKYKTLSVDKKKKSQAPNTCHDLCVKLVQDVKKSVDAVDEKRRTLATNIAAIKLLLDALSTRVRNYDELMVRVVPGLKNALQMEAQEMEKRLLALFESF